VNTNFVLGCYPLGSGERKEVFRFSVDDDLDASFLDEGFDALEEITVLELEELADALRFLLDLEPYTCPKRGVDIPCIVCEDVCGNVGYQEVETKLGRGRKTINSSIISLRFEKHDEVERYLVKRLVRELARKKLNVIDTEEGYDVTFLFTHEDRWRADEIISFILNLFEKVKEMMAEAKSVLNSWIRKKVEEFKREERRRK